MSPLIISTTQLVVIIIVHVVSLSVFFTLQKARIDAIEKWMKAHTEFSDNWIKEHDRLTRERETSIAMVAQNVAVLSKSVDNFIENTRDRFNRLEGRVDETHDVIERRFNKGS